MSDWWDVLHLFLSFHGKFFLPTIQTVLFHGKLKSSSTLYQITHFFFQLVIKISGDFHHFPTCLSNHPSSMAIAIYFSFHSDLGCQKGLVICKQGEENSYSWWSFLCTGKCKSCCWSKCMWLLFLHFSIRLGISLLDL